jgi:hypothetical protein
LIINYLFDKKKGKLFFTGFFFECECLWRSEKKSAVVAGRVLNFGTKEGNIGQTDRVVDYMCFSPLRRKTSELEGEEYTSSGKKFFLFIGHEVLFYEMPFLHRARRNYVCGAVRRSQQ